MSSPSLDKRRYFSPDWFETECHVLESKLWHFAALAGDLAADNDFVTVQIAGKSVIVQNFGGTLRAFENVCAHRFCRIRSEPRGNGVLRCPYHAWQYNRDGVPLGIPAAEEAFGLDREGKQRHMLRPWRLERCGDFVFIRGGEDGPDLRTFLGPAFDELDRLSRCIGEAQDEFVCEYGANWKICIENTIDEYHAAFVHPSTFRHLLSGRFEYGYEGIVSKVDADVTEDALRKWKRIDKFFANRPLRSDRYHHYVLFPLATVATTFGATFSIQTFEPLSPDRTLFRTRIHLSRFEGKPPPESAVRALVHSAMDFNRTVFLEDKFVCEQVQLGMRQNARLPGLIGRYEQRIAHFQQAVERHFG